MKLKFVKLIARSNTWFKEGTEVYDYDADYSDKKMVTLDYWDTCRKEGNGICVRGICVRGIRVCELGYETDGSLGYKNGDEREDGEYCSCDEFDVEIIEK
jgi:hypothetical protein